MDRYDRELKLKVNFPKDGYTYLILRVIFFGRRPHSDLTNLSLSNDIIPVSSSARKLE